MRYRRISFATMLLACAWAVQAATCPPLLDHQFKRLQDGAPQHLCQYHGNVVLVVNTASYCGYTKQYDGLEKLYAKYQARGLVVLGFPSNDFGGQEPGTEQEIEEFCRLTYGVRFPMLAKTDIAPPKTHSFYAMLGERAGSLPKWNFHKYLIDREGRQVAGFASAIKPDDPALIKAIEARLEAPAPR